VIRNPYFGATLILLFCFKVLGCAKGVPIPEDGTLATVGGDRISVEKFEARVEQAMDEAAVSGLGCAVLNDGRVVYHRTFGFRDNEAGHLLDRESVFNAASFSKTVFAYLVMVLADEGLIDVDRPLHEYLEKAIPDYEDYADLAGDDRWRDITARMALSHTIGFPNWRFLTDDKRLSFLFDPGDRFSYSGEGIHLLQMAVEEITGEDLESLAREKVFGPLGMRDTSYVWQQSYEGSYALPHNEFGWAGNPNRRGKPAAAGSMTTTAVDYGRLLEAVIATERLPNQNGQEMLSPAIRIRSERMLGPGAWRDAESGYGVDLSWGLGWGLFDSPRGRAFFHTGHDVGAQNYTVTFLDQGIGIVLLSNSANFESIAAEIVEAGIGDVYSPFEWLGYTPFDPTTKKTPPARPERIVVSAETITPYTGKYRISVGEVFWIKADGKRLLYSGEDKYWDEIIAESKTRFRFRGQDISLTFVPEPDGRVDRVDIDYQGLSMTAARVE
jgi:CubicO group peptidase (beta-lactamase class C family)